MLLLRSTSRFRDFKTSSIFARPNFWDSTKRSTMSDSGKHSETSASAGGYRDRSPTDSLFKRTFKYYKRRDQSPELDRVLDLRCTANGVSCSPFVPHEALSARALHSLGLRPVSEWTASTVSNRPGMVMLNDIFQPSKHLDWIKRALLNYAEAPGFTNVGLHYPNVTQVFKNHPNQLRWSTLGLHYDWETKIYPTAGEPLPDELALVADLLSRALGRGPMFADATIVNYYTRKSTLSPHVDRSERNIEAPLISLSFGQSAIYLAGGTALDDPIDAIYIHSGDALVIFGDQRLIYHGVPRIVQTRTFDATTDDGMPSDVVAYANQNRVNITIRQVDEHQQQQQHHFANS